MNCRRLLPCLVFVVVVVLFSYSPKLCPLLFSLSLFSFCSCLFQHLPPPFSPVLAAHLNLTFNSKQTTRICSKQQRFHVSVATTSCPPAPFPATRPPSLLLLCFTYTFSTPSPPLCGFYFGCTNAFLTALFHVFAVLSSDLQNALKLFLYLIDTLLQYAYGIHAGLGAYGARFLYSFFRFLGRVNIELYLWTRFRCISKGKGKKNLNLVRNIMNIFGKIEE